MDIHFFQRLGNVRDRQGRPRNGVETLRTHLDHMAATGSDCTWFCTDSLARGMSPIRVAQFQTAIAQGLRPLAWFMISPRAGGMGDLEWAAAIVDLASAPFGLPCPEPDLYPPCWRSWGKTWLKLRHLAPCTDRSLADFVILGTGHNLALVVRKSQYKCGYISPAGSPAGGVSWAIEP